MRTSKPISTISYNTDQYLVDRLQELELAKIIEFWCFVRHMREDDETKEHIHLYIEPCKLIQTADLKEHFKEMIPGEERPLGTISFVSSKFVDWYLYSSHDEAYLREKGQTRRYSYPQESFVSSDWLEFDYRVKQIEQECRNTYTDMRTAIKQGFTWGEYSEKRNIPVGQYLALQRMWSVTFDEVVGTYRNGRQGHENNPYTAQQTKKGKDEP